MLPGIGTCSCAVALPFVIVIVCADPPLTVYVTVMSVDAAPGATVNGKLRLFWPGLSPSAWSDALPIETV